MKTKFIIVFCCLSFANLISQNILPKKSLSEINTLPKEKIFVHFNSNFLLTGETLLYKTYCLKENNEFSSLSKVVYVALLDNDKNIILEDKIRLIDGVANGNIFISSEIKSGSYKLISYTNLMKNYNNFFQEDLYIINPFNEKVKIDSSDKTSLNNITSNNKNIEINKKDFKPREKVIIKIPESKFKKYKYSVSVRKTIPNTFKHQLNSVNFKSIKLNKTLVNKSENFIVPDFRGQLISGIVKDKITNAPLKNKTVAISFIDKKGFFKIAKTNSKGVFYTNLNNDNYSNKIYAQVLDDNLKNSKINLIKKKNLDFSNLKFHQLKVNKSLSKTIKNHTIYNQIYNIYKDQDSVLNLKNKTSIFNKYFTVYKLSNFTSFKTIQEIMIEIIDGAWIDKKGDNYTFSVRNNKALNNSKTLLIVDGYVVKNHNELIDINTKSIDKISVLVNSYLLNSTFYNGIIKIETLKGNYTPKSKNLTQLKIKNLEPIRKYNFPDYSKNNKNRIPDYRTQLFWEPNLDQNKKEISFYTSDVLGEFEIISEGFSNTGLPISLRKKFNVN